MEHWYDDEMLNAVNRWEDMIKKHQRRFFDVEELEDIIDYYMETNDFHRAAQAADYAAGLYPTATSIQFRIAEILIDNGQPAKALSLLNKLERLESGDYFVYLLKGTAFNLLGKARDAQRQFEKAISLADEDKIYVLYDIGTSFERINQHKIALKYFLKVHNMDPDNYYVYYDLAYCYDRINELDSSVNYYLKYLDEDPFSEHVWYNLGTVYNKKDEDEKAIEAYDYALAVNPLYSSALFNKANTLTSMDKYEEAIEVYGEFLKIEPDNAAAYCYIGECYGKIGDSNTAMMFFGKSLTMDENFSDTWYGMGVIHAQSENYKEAIRCILQAIKLDKDNTEYLLALAASYANMQQYGKALKLFRLLVSLNPLEELYWDGYAQTYAQQDEYIDAQQIATEGLRHIPDSAMLRYHLAAFYLLNDDRLQGLTILKETLDACPAYIGYFYELFDKAGSDDEVIALVRNINKKNYM
jgi:tetratricopeptide (TPR) repeat protein